MTMVETKAGGLGPNEKFIGQQGSRAGLNTPALLLDLDALDANIAAMAAHTKAAGINLRPHSKGAKSIEIGRRQMAAGAIGICCTTVGEAEVIAGGGIKGVLITSPVVTAPMIERLIALNKQAKGLMAVADNPANADALAGAAQKSGTTLSGIFEYSEPPARPRALNIATTQPPFNITTRHQK
jgi:D-serine deaminase-like pyridoxal phosphate-dependent protein